MILVIWVLNLTIMAFGKTKKHLVDQARKAMFSLVRKARKLFLPFDIQLHLFDSMITPILLYGTEMTNIDNILRFGVVKM